MSKFFSKIKPFISCIAIVVCSTIPNAVSATGYGVTVSPMNERIILNPGETYRGSFNIANSSENTGTFRYVAEPKAFFVDDNYDIYYEAKDNLNQIVDWIKIENPTGILDVNSFRELKYTINVPKDAPAGGQYVAIMVRSAEIENVGGEGSAVKLTQSIGIAHIIYAEIAGTSVHSGEIESVELPGFVMTDNIAGSSIIKNTGNVHGVATYKLQVFPLFSNEEVYTNEEEPNTLTVLPGRSRYNETAWTDTPMFGVFNVVYTVEFEGVTQQVSKMVIKCPIWLLFIIIFIITAIIIYFIMRAKSRKNSRKRIETQ